MSAYDYDALGFGVSLHASDRSQNGAKALEGDYHLELTPQSDWPGRSVAAGEIRMELDAILEIADWLDNQAGIVENVPSRLRASTSGLHFGPGGWSEAGSLAQSSQQVSQAIDSFGVETVRNLRSAARAIRTAVETSSRADASAVSTSDRLQSALGGSPAGPTVSGSDL